MRFWNDFQASTVRREIADVNSDTEQWIVTFPIRTEKSKTVDAITVKSAWAGAHLYTTVPKVHERIAQDRACNLENPIVKGDVLKRPIVEQ